MERSTIPIKNLKPNNFVLIDNIPCKVEKVTVSSPGKHGSARCRVDAVGLLDKKKRSIVKPSGDTVYIPIINRKNAQVLAVVGEKVQLMDLENYSVFELPIPEELKDQIKPGTEIPYFELMGEKTLKKLK
jgi:translation initiation factor 5A